MKLRKMNKWVVGRFGFRGSDNKMGDSYSIHERIKNLNRITADS